MNEEAKPKLRDRLEVVYHDQRRETIILKRLSNTDMVKWIDTGLDKAFLVFRSIERADPAARADQSWFDSLAQDSAFAVVEKSLALNHSPALKKTMAAVAANLQSWLSATPSTSSAPADANPKP